MKKSLIDLTVDGNAIKGVLSDDDGKPISSAEIKYTANGNYASVLTGRDGSFTIEPQAGDEACRERIDHLRRALIDDLIGREEGHTDGEKLICGRPCNPILKAVFPDIAARPQ